MPLTPNARAVQLVTERLTHGLQHPGNPAANQKPFTIPLPGLRTTGIPPGMAQQFAATAGLPTADVPKLIAEAIVHQIETELDGGSEIISKTDLAALRRQAADAPDGTRIITLRCTCHHQDLMQVVIGKDDHVRINPDHLARALQHHTTR